MEIFLKRFLRLAFDINEGEYRRALLMQLNIFLIVLTLLIVKPVATALFLSNVGIEQLPIVFVLVAVAAMIISSIYAYQLGRVSLKSIITSTIGIAVFSLLVLGVLLKLEPIGLWIYYLFYIAVAIFGVVATSQVWILANLLFTSREASRLFGFIGAGAIAGGITGGYLTSLLAPLISSDNLIFVGALLLAACIPLSSHIWKEHIVNLNVLQHQKRLTHFGDHPIKIIRNSRHLLFLASIVGVGVIVAKLVDYQFSALASASIESSDELAAFFGFWFSTFNVLSLIVQLFLTRQIVGMYGIGASLFLLPAALFFGASLLLFFPVLSLGIFLKAADVTLKQSINKSATELLALPIPVSIKNQTKSFIDIFVDSAATGIGGLMLIFMVSGLELQARYVSLLILPLAAVWVYFAIGVRREYLKSFRRKISAQADDPSDLMTEVGSDTLVGGLRRVLLSGSESQMLYVLQKVAEQRDSRLFEEVRALLHHSSERVRSAALQTLYFFHSPNISDEVESLIGDASSDVQVHAVEYLISHAGDDKIELIDRYLKHDDDAVNGAALVGVASEARNNPEMIKLFKLEKRISDKLGYLQIMEDPISRKQYRVSVVRAIGRANLDKFYPVLDTALEDQDPDIVTEAIVAAGLTLNSRFSGRICRFLTVNTFRETAIRSLAGCGKGIWSVLNQLMEADECSIEAVRALPKVAERLGEQESVSFLFGLVDHDDITVQIEALRSLNNLKMKYPLLAVDRKDVIELIVHESKLYLDTIAALYAETKLVGSPAAQKNPAIDDAMRSLIMLLEKRLDVILERIFRLLGLRYPPEEILPVYEGLQSDSQDLRINSVEYLYNILYGHLKRILTPIIETAMLQTVSEETIKSLKINVPNQRQCLEMLLAGRDVKIRQSVLYLIEQMKDASYLPLVQAHTSHPNPKIKDFAMRAERAIVEHVSSP